MADHNEPSLLRDIHAMLDQAGISLGSLGQRVAGALADRQAWIDRAHELAVERDQAITERNAGDLRVTLGKVRAQRDAALRGGLADERKPCGCILGARWITVKHCGGHAIPADERLGGGR